MAGRKKTTPDLGFNIEAARTALTSWLTSNDVLSQRKIDEWISHWRSTPRREGSVSDARWGTLWSVGFEHASKHGISTGHDDIVAPCTTSRCRAAGVSFALLELYAYHRGNDSYALNIAKDLDELAAQHRNDDELVVRIILAAEAAQSQLEELQRSVKEGFLQESVWPGCIKLANAARALPLALEYWAQKVREGCSQDTAQATGARKPGRPTDSLLIAVWQQLRKGGFQWQEVAAMVPPNDPARSLKGTAERIRQRASGVDHRTITAWSATPVGGSPHRRKLGS